MGAYLTFLLLKSFTDLTDYDDTMGRAKIVEYLYNEYSLEEILYKLAKVLSEKIDNIPELMPLKFAGYVRPIPGTWLR